MTEVEYEFAGLMGAKGTNGGAKVVVDEFKGSVITTVTALSSTDGSSMTGGGADDDVASLSRFDSTTSANSGSYASLSPANNNTTSGGGSALPSRAQDLRTLGQIRAELRKQTMRLAPNRTTTNNSLSPTRSS